MTATLTVRQQAHQTLLEKISKRALFYRINQIPKLTDCRIMYYDGERL